MSKIGCTFDPFGDILIKSEFDKPLLRSITIMENEETTTQESNESYVANSTKEIDPVELATILIKMEHENSTNLQSYPRVGMGIFVGILVMLFTWLTIYLLYMMGSSDPAMSTFKLIVCGIFFGSMSGFVVAYIPSRKK